MLIFVMDVDVIIATIVLFMVDVVYATHKNMHGNNLMMP